jgi:hypothetical protein
MTAPDAAINAKGTLIRTALLSKAVNSALARDGNLRRYLCSEASVPRAVSAYPAGTPFRGTSRIGVDITEIGASVENAEQNPRCRRFRCRCGR